MEPSRSVTGLSLLLADCSTPAKARYYIDAGKWQQIKLMETEWLTDATPCDGGAEAFAADSGSYLITSAAALDAYPQYEVIRQTEEFSLLYNP